MLLCLEKLLYPFYFTTAINAAKIYFMKRILIIYKFISLFIFSGLIMFCAHKVAPTGGPEDKTPPVIVNHFPQKDSVGLKRLEYIEIEFDENIRKTSLTGNYWLIPELENPLEIKWKGSRKVRFYLKDSLEINQTYLFTLGTGIKDLRNNAMEAPFQLAFSSGKRLNRGLISGSVYSEKKEREVFIYAYPLSGDLPQDSLLSYKAQYYTQINAEGNFVLNYLAFGQYRVIALVDQDYNYVYNIEADLIGIPFSDIVLDSLHPSFSNLNFYLIQEDTTAPFIKAIDTVSTHEIVIEFSEPIQSAMFSVNLEDSVSGQFIYPVAVSFDPIKNSMIHGYFQDLPKMRTMELSITAVQDLAGNIAKYSTLSGFFQTSNHQDTTQPQITEVNPLSKSLGIPFDSHVLVFSNSPVDSNSFRKIFSLIDEDSSKVAGNFNFGDLCKPRFIPDTLLRSNMMYTVKLELDRLTDLFGRKFPDTTLVSQFTSADLTNLGEISGKIYVPEENWLQAIVRAKKLRGIDFYQTISQVNETYQLDYLPAGSFLMDCVIDINKNRAWDKGATSPWQFAEPYLTMSDTVRVRKRWTSQGIDFNFNFRESP